jgi:hypothetical protein
MSSFKKILIAVLFGTLYLISGSVMILSVIIPALAELTGPLLIPADPAAGFALCVVGLVFLFAYRHLAESTPEGLAFLYVGMALSVIFGIVALLSLLAQGSEILLFGEGETWNPVRVLVPMVYLALVPAICLFTWGRGFISNLTGA